MKVTRENYFSPEVMKEYMSASQFKSFMQCEAKALAEVNGEYSREINTSLLVGKYVDAYFSGDLEELKVNTPELFTQKGELRSDFKKAENIIKRIESDEFLMEKVINASEKQKIFIGEIAGVKFKAMLDFINDKRITDMKIMKDFEPIWNKENKEYQEWWQNWGYDIQGAIYKELVNNPEIKFGLISASKEDEPDLVAISLSDRVLLEKLELVKSYAPRFDDIKKGKIEPEACGKCDYCRSKKKLTGFTVIE